MTADRELTARTEHELAVLVIEGTYGPNYLKANADLRSCE
jgi:hypothetical protein